MRKPYRDDVRLSIKLIHVLMEAPEPILKEVDFDSRRGFSTDLDEIGRAVESFDDFVYLRIRIPRGLLSNIILTLRNSNRGFNQAFISAFETLADGGG